MQVNWNNALRRVLVLEGGYVNHPRDPGGETNKGVTKRVYDAYRRQKGRAIQSVKFITAEEVSDIYRVQYADKIMFDRLPSGVDEVVFDGAVNSGVSQSIKWLQRAVGNVRVDGVMGIATLNAALAHPDHDKLVATILDRRMAFLRALKTWGTFGKGWTNRLAHVRKTGYALATGSVGPAPAFFAGGNAKAYIEDAKAPPSKAIGDATAGGGVVALGLEQITGALGNLSWLPGVDKLVSIVTVVGVIMIVGGGLYRWYQKTRETALNDALDKTPELPPAPEPARDEEVEQELDAVLPA